VIRVIIMLAIIAPGTAGAQVFHPTADDARVHSVGLSAGFDHGGVVEASYVRRLALRTLPRSALLASLEAPSVPLPGDGGVQVGLATGFVASSGWGVTPQLAATARWVNGSLFDVMQLGIVASASAGYFRPRWQLALDLAWDKSLVTHVSPNTAYMQTYAGAESGWYGSGGGSVRAGLASSAIVTDRIEVSLRAGVVTTESLHAMPGLPFYVLAGTAARF
jgi:hypothetical protein